MLAAFEADDVDTFARLYWETQDISELDEVLSGEFSGEVCRYLLETPLIRKRHHDFIETYICDVIDWSNLLKGDSLEKLIEIVENWSGFLEIEWLGSNVDPAVEAVLFKHSCVENHYETNTKQEVARAYLKRYGLEERKMAKFLEPGDPLSWIGEKLRYEWGPKLPQEYLLSKPLENWMLYQIDLEKSIKVGEKTSFHPSWWQDKYFQDKIFPKIFGFCGYVPISLLPIEAINFLANDKSIFHWSKADQMELMLRCDQLTSKPSLYGKVTLNWLSNSRDKKLVSRCVDRLFPRLREETKEVFERTIRNCHPWAYEIKEHQRLLVSYLDPETVRKSPEFCRMFDRETFDLFLERNNDFFSKILSGECFDALCDSQAIDFENTSVKIGFKNINKVQHWENASVLKSLFLAFCRGHEVDPLKLEYCYSILEPTDLSPALQAKFRFGRGSSRLGQGETDLALEDLLQLPSHPQANRLVGRVVHEKTGFTPQPGFGVNLESILWLLNKK